MEVNLSLGEIYEISEVKGSTWRILPEVPVDQRLEARLLIQNREKGVYETIISYRSEQREPGQKWIFEVGNSDGYSRNSLILKFGEHEVNRWTYSASDVLGWKLDFSKQFEVLPVLGEVSPRNNHFPVQTINGDNLTDLSQLRSEGYTVNRPPDRYLRSLCCLKNHYGRVKEYLDLGKKCFPNDLLNIEMDCLLKLFEALKHSILNDIYTQAHEPSVPARHLFEQVYSLLISSKGFYLAKEDGTPITSLTDLETTHVFYYGVRKYNHCTCKMQTLYLHNCFV